MIRWANIIKEETNAYLGQHGTGDVKWSTRAGGRWQGHENCGWHCSRIETQPDNAMGWQ